MLTLSPHPCRVQLAPRGLFPQTARCTPVRTEPRSQLLPALLGMVLQDLVVTVAAIAAAVAVAPAAATEAVT